MVYVEDDGVVVVGVLKLFEIESVGSILFEVWSLVINLFEILIVGGDCCLDLKCGLLEIYCYRCDLF